MKKILLSIAVVVITAISVNAQSYILSQDGVVLGDTISIFPETPEVTELLFHAAVTNNTGHNSEVMVTRNTITPAGESYTQLCWAGSCLPPSVDTAGPQSVDAGVTTGEHDLDIHYIFNGAVGMSVIEFIIYDRDNPSEVSKIVVNFYSSPDAINENILKNIWLSDVYPNPASNFVAIDYNLPQEVTYAKAKIVSLLGSVVSEQNIDIQGSSMRMDVSGLKSGIYFYSLFVNDEIYSTKKLIIR